MVVKRNIFVETERLLLGELLPLDDKGMFELDSDHEVHQYLGDAVVEKIEQSQEVIEMIRKQYREHGIGRWAVLEKATQNFLGWAGLKLSKDTINKHSNFYDLGYRFIQKYWGNGFATEAAKASLLYGFEVMELHCVYAQADSANTASRNVLEKSGLRYVETFDDDGYAVDWFAITKEEWVALPKNPTTSLWR